jgi:N-acetyl sugar amidotransferase
MDSSDPDITFTSNGRCNHCVTAEINLQHFREIRSDDQLAFENLVDEIRSSPGKEGFHGIIGVSGGVDSSYLIHKLKQSGLKLLAVHVDAGWNSIEAVGNISKMVTDLDIELETIVIDWQEMRDLQISYLRSGVINQDVPQDHAFFSSLYKLARKYQIKYVISGSNFATESILPTSWGQDAMDGRQLLDIHSRHGSKVLDVYPVTYLSDLYFHSYIKRDYKVVAPLNLLDYSKKLAIKVLMSDYNWKDYGGKHKESRFTDFFQEIYLPERFGIQKKRAHLSSLIVNQEISREEALEVIASSGLSELERDNLVLFVAGKLDIPRDELEFLIKLPLTDHSTYANQAYLKRVLTYAGNVRAKFRQKLRR